MGLLKSFLRHFSLFILVSLILMSAACQSDDFTDNRSYQTPADSSKNTNDNDDKNDKNDDEEDDQLTDEEEPIGPTPAELLQASAIEEGKSDGKVFYDSCVAACHIANPANDPNIGLKNVNSIALAMSVNHFNNIIEEDDQKTVKAYVYGMLNFNDAIENLYPITDYN